MKKIFFVSLFFIAVSNTLCAQNFRIGFTTGMEVSNYSTYFDGGQNDAKLNPKVGFKVGFIGEYAISKHLFLTPEFCYTQRGVREKAGISSDGPYHDYSEKINYLQIPINATYKFDISPFSKIVVFAGVYGGLAISGNSKEKNSNNKETVSEFEFGSEQGEYKKTDWGLNMGLGYEYVDIFVKIQYNPGSVNLLNVEDRSYIKHRNVGLSVGFIF